MKKLTVAFLIVSMLFNGFTFRIVRSDATDEPTAVEEDAASPAIETIFSLGILSKTTDDTLDLSGEVSRMDFAIMLYDMLNYQNKGAQVTASEAYFEDVGLYHYGAGYVQYLVALGVISGNGSGKFNPDDGVTLRDACKMALVAAGYRDYLNATGNQYMITAAELGLLKTGAVSADESLTRKTAAELLYRLMDVEVQVPTTYQNGEIGYTSRKDFKYVVMKVDCTEGILDGVQESSLYGTALGKDLISIGEKAYSSTLSVDSKLLGYHVKGYFDTEHDNQMIALVVQKNEVLEINAKDIGGYSDRKYTYYSEGKTMTASIDRQMDLLYNGYYTSDTSLVVPDYGAVTLIDHNNDGVYDVLSITAYESYVVDKVSIVSNTVIFKNLDANGANRSIQLDEFDQFEVVNSNNQAIKLSQIGENQVVTVQIAGTRFAKLMQSTKTLTGAIEETNQDDRGYHLYVDGTWYDCSKNMYSGDSGVALIENVILLFDVNGQVAGITNGSQSGWKLGYIMGIDLKSGVSGLLQMKLLTEDGTIQILDSEDKIKIDGQASKNPSEAYAYLNTAYDHFVDDIGSGDAYRDERVTTRLIRYYIQDQRIKQVDTPRAQSINDSEEPYDASVGNLLLKRSKGHLYYKPQLNALKQVYPYRMDLVGDVIMTNQTKVFIVPEAENKSPDDDDYGVVTPANAGFSDEFYYVSGYNTDSNKLECDAVVVRKSKGSSALESLMVYDKYSQVLDEDGETRIKITGLIGGDFNSYVLKENNAYQNQLSSFVQGDVLRYRISDNELDITGITYNSVGTGEVNQSAYFVSSGTTTHFNVDVLRVTKGFAERIANGYMAENLNSTAVVDDVITLPSKIYFYDKNKSATKGRIFIGSGDDIYTKMSHPGSYDTILVSIKSGIIKEVIAIRQ